MTTNPKKIIVNCIEPENIDKHASGKEIVFGGMAKKFLSRKMF